MSQRVYTLFQQSVEAKMQVGEALAPLIDIASDLMVEALLSEKKILVCGNGISSSLAQTFSSCMLDRYEKERPSLPTICLSSNVAMYTEASTGDKYNDIYAKPLRALGNEGDILLVISNSGNATNLIRAISAAHDKRIHVIALTGGDGGNIASLLDANDIEMRAAIASRSRINEIQLLTLFCLCDLIDNKIFGIE